jgi:hypothetical protein
MVEITTISLYWLKVVFVLEIFDYFGDCITKVILMNSQFAKSCGCLKLYGLDVIRSKLGDGNDYCV